MGVHIRELVDKFLSEKRQERKEGEVIQQIISRFLEAEAQEGIHFKGIFNREAIFKSTSSSSSYDFKLKKDKILTKIQEEFPKVKNIRVELG